MKVPLPIPCSECGVKQIVKVTMPGSDWNWTRDRCGHANVVIRDVAFTHGKVILEKARHEYLVEDDFDTSIVFSAMAVDCELARLY